MNNKNENINRDFKGIWIPKEIWLAEDLSWSAKILLTEIDSLATNGECFATNNYFAKFLGLTKVRISNLISELKAKGYIDVKIIYKSNTKQIEKRVITTNSHKPNDFNNIREDFSTPIKENNNTLLKETLIPPYKKFLYPIKEKFNTPIKENFKDNNTSNNNTTNNTINSYIAQSDKIAHELEN